MTVSRIQPVAPRALRPSEVKATYGFSRSQVYKLIGAGRLKTVKVGRMRLIPIESLEALIKGEAA